MGMLNENVHSESFVDDFMTRSASLKNFEGIEFDSIENEARTKEFDNEKFKKGSAMFTKWLGKELIGRK